MLTGRMSRWKRKRGSSYARKGPSETWNEFLLGLVEQVPRKADTGRLEREHIHAIARTTADELEE